MVLKLKVKVPGIQGPPCQPGASGVTDHGALTGLTNDDHPLYHTNARGDARYYTKAQIDALITDAVNDVLDGAPGAMDTLKELADALGDDADFAATVTAALAGKASSVHQHAIDQIIGLQAALDTKQPSGSYAAAAHSHPISDVNGLQGALDAKQPAGSYAAAAHNHDDRYFTETETNALMVPLKKRTGVKVARAGDSMTDFDSFVDATQVSMQDRSAMGWLQFLSEWAFDYEIGRDDNNLETGANFGVGGDTTGELLNRIQPIVDYDADLYFVMLGTNNLVNYNTYNFTNTSQELDSIYNQLSAKGGEIVPIVIPPRSYWNPLNSAQISTARNLQNRVNTWIRKKIYTGRTQNIKTVIDPTPYWIDPASATGDPLADKTVEGLHQNGNGGYNLGKAMWDGVKSRFGKIPPRVKSQADLYHASENPEGCINANPLMTGTTGSKGTGETGDVATGYTSSRGTGTSLTCVAAKGATALDGSPGTHQILPIVSNGAGADGELWYYHHNITTNFAPGDLIYTRWPVIIGANADILNGCYLEVRFEGATGGMQYARHLNWTAGRLPLADLIAGIKGMFGHNRYKVPPGTTNIRVRIVANIRANVAGTVTLKIGELATRKFIA